MRIGSKANPTYVARPRLILTLPEAEQLRLRWEDLRAFKIEDIPDFNRADGNPVFPVADNVRMSIHLDAAGKPIQYELYKMAPTTRGDGDKRINFFQRV